MIVNPIWQNAFKPELINNLKRVAYKCDKVPLGEYISHEDLSKLVHKD